MTSHIIISPLHHEESLSSVVSAPATSIVRQRQHPAPAKLTAALVERDGDDALRLRPRYTSLMAWHIKVASLNH